MNRIGHSGIHENVERPQDDQIKEPKLGDNHAFGPSGARENLKTEIGAPSTYSRDRDWIVEEDIVKRHFPPDHGRQRIMRQHNGIAAAIKIDRNSRRNLVGAEKSRRRAPAGVGYGNLGRWAWVVLIGLPRESKSRAAPDKVETDAVSGLKTKPRGTAVVHTVRQMLGNRHWC